MITPRGSSAVLLAAAVAVASRRPTSTLPTSTLHNATVVPADESRHGVSLQHAKQTQKPHNATVVPAEEARQRRMLSDGVSFRATQTQELIAADGAPGDRFGARVAVSGGYLAVGAYEADDSRGSVYVYNLTAEGLWTFMQRIGAPDAAYEDDFGRAVAISGDHLVVGALFDDDGGEDSGSVYVFNLTDDGFRFAQKLVAPPDAAAGDHFGDAVAVSRNHLVAGAPRDDHGGGTDAGAAYIYALTDGGAWDYVQKLVASDATAGAFFGGVSVAMSENQVVVGAYGDDDLAGSAYVFRTSDGGDSWVQDAKIVADDRAAGAYFGASVAIDGNHTTVVGALFDDRPNAGAVYVFVESEGIWTQAQKIVAPDGGMWDHFGGSVSVSGTTLAVGAYFDDDAGTNSGSVFIYRLNGGTWDYLQKLVASDTAAGESFGISVALSVNQLIVGAYSWGAGGPGSAYAYRWESCAEMAMSDAAGDGWNGTFYAFTSVTSGEVVETGTLALGSSGSDEVCLVDGCYILEVGGGGGDMEDISWTFAAIAGEAPYGPTELFLDSGDVFESMCPSPLPTPRPTPAPTPSPTPSPTPAPIPSPTPQPTPSPTLSPTPSTVVDAVLARADLSTLAALLDAADLSAELSRPDSTYTVFAPTNGAFESAFPGGASDAFTQDELRAMLEHHVAPVRSSSSAFFDGLSLVMLDGSPVTISIEPLRVARANILITDVVAANGILHVIDAVLYEDASHDRSSGKSKRKSAGTIVGAVLGALAGLTALVFLLYQAYRAYQERQEGDATFCELWCRNIRINLTCGCCSSTTDKMGQGGGDATANKSARNKKYEVEAVVINDALRVENDGDAVGETVVETKKA